MGGYHGKFSFDTFSHYKPVLETGTGMEFLNKLVTTNNSKFTVRICSAVLHTLMMVFV